MDHARKEIRDMIDATLSVIVREHAVDESYVISEIKNYLSKTDVAATNNNSLKVIRQPKISVQERRLWHSGEHNSFESAKNQCDSYGAMAA
ncbi:MAG: hypothetical protein VYE46_04530 [Cyanobacteriota bacterium]|nr:hypothetical protein [Cyanobacteriota bacterium]